MQPTRALWRKQADLLAADTATLAAAMAMHVHLCKAPFVPSLDLLLASLTEATFTGSTALAAGTGTQPDFYDVADGALTIQIKEPAGGWLWTCTADPASPEIIYGWYLTDNADAVLYGAALLIAPVTINAAGQAIDIGEVTLKWLPQSPY